MVQARLFIVLFLLFLSVQPTSASLMQAPVVSGHLKTLNIGYDNPPGTNLDDGFFSANSQRINLKGQLGETLELEFALDNQLLYSDPPGQVNLPADSPNRRLDMQHDWNRGQHWSDQLTVDRLSLRGSLENFDWSIGRQAIGFGRIVIFSPLDVVAPFPPDALDSDIRPGVDAIRGTHYFGLGGQVGGTAVFGPTTEDNSYLLTLSENRAKIDFLTIGGVLRDREMLGLGLAGSIGTLGVKLEVSHYNGKNPELPGGDLHDQFDIGALEFWYRFESGIVLLTQYLYNGAGAGQPLDYISAASSASFNEGLSFLLGQQYLLIGPSWEFHPLMTLSGLAIWNLDDNSTMLRPQIQFSLGDNLNLDLFYSFNIGEEPQLIAPGISVPRSEFGSVGNSGGLLLRWYL
jgi:hypothetical protein